MATRQRQAFIWKNQESLTKVKKLDENKLSLEERLRVRIALKVMRKAHIHGSRAQKDKYDILRSIIESFKEIKIMG
jgi:hypothetical protein